MHGFGSPETRWSVGISYIRTWGKNARRTQLPTVGAAGACWAHASVAVREQGSTIPATMVLP